MTEIRLPYTAEDHVQELLQYSEKFRRLVEVFDLRIDYSQKESR